MKDDHITLRLPRALARAVARWASDRGIAKSQVVREAVARYLEPHSTLPAAPAVGGTAADLLTVWSRRPALSPEDARALADDVDEARRLPAPRAPWG
jgi:hypothetical protein